MKRFVKGFLDLLTVFFLTGYGQRPLHLLGTFGLICFLIGGAGLAYLAGYWVLRTALHAYDWTPLHQRPAVIYSAGALLLGGQFMCVGILAEMMTAYYRRDVVPYSVAERTGEAVEEAFAASTAASEEPVRPTTSSVPFPPK
jgi:dolichol-phosphate mannosyltransferase